MTWRLAPCLQIALDEANRLAPKRSKVSDGTVGDQAHRARRSGHNPNSRGIVTALDLTHDPVHGWDTHAQLDRIRIRRDPRVKFIISARRIAGPGSKAGGWEWHPYTGPNPHDRHGHLEVWSVASLEDDRSPWWIHPTAAPTPNPKELSMKVPGYFKTLVAPNGGWWHAAADGGIYTATNGAGSPAAPFKGSIPGVGGLPDGSTVVDFVPHLDGYAFVVRHTAGDITGYHFP